MAVSAISQPRPGFWASVLEAIRGTKQDFTEGSIGRAVLLLATPMVLEMMMESLFAIVNVFWVTRLGADAVATVGLTESMMTIVFAFGIGVSMSTTAMVARRIGEKDTRGAATAGVQAIFLGIGLSILMGVPAFLLAPRLLAAMGATPQLVSTGQHYTAIVLGANVVVILLFLNNAIFRGSGDASVAMRVLWISNLINLALDPCLIFGLGPFPELGITGAAVSTLTGRSVGVALQLWTLTSGRTRVHIRPSDWKIVPDVLARLARVSSTGVLQFAVGNLSWLILVRMISTFGSLAVAGYTIGIRIFIFAILPSWGLSGAAATMVGQNLGSQKPERAVKAVYITGFYNAAYLGAVSLVFIFAPDRLVGLFTDDANVMQYAIACLRTIGFGNVAYAFGMVMVQAFNGAGDTVTPTLINMIGFWLCEIPLAWALAFYWGMGVQGIFLAIPIAHALITVMGVTMFLRGSWKRRSI
jgi:putative MATE family efflux protein